MQRLTGQSDIRLSSINVTKIGIKRRFSVEESDYAVSLKHMKPNREQNV